MNLTNMSLVAELNSIYFQPVGYTSSVWRYQFERKFNFHHFVLEFILAMDIAYWYTSDTFSDTLYIQINW